MKRRGILALCGVAGIVIVVAAAIPALRSIGTGNSVPVCEVRRGDFVRTVIAEGNLKAETATPLSTPMEVRRSVKIAWLAPDGVVVAEGDVVVRFDPTEMENNLYDGTAEREAVDNDMARKKTEDGAVLSNLERDAGLAGRELEYAREFQSKDPDIFSRSEIIESEIDESLAIHRKEHATGSRLIRKELSRVEMDLLAIKRKKAELKIEEAEQGLAALEVRAPHDGIFVLYREWGEVLEVGEVVWPGRQIAEIPMLEKMEARVYILEADAGGLEVGCEGEVILESHPDRPVSAKVKKVAALAMSRGYRSPVQYFEVVMELEKTEPEWMKPGQRVRAELYLDRASDVLSVPREAVFEQDDGTRVVYRGNGWDFEAVEVELGAAALGRVIIESGLEEGDTIALHDPTRNGNGKGNNTSSSGTGVAR